MSLNGLRRLKCPISLLALGGLAMSLTACSSAASDGSGGETSDDVVAEATANLKTYYANTDAALDTDGLVKNNLKGKKLFYIADISVPSGTVGLKALKEAQSKLGFDLKVFDGQFSPAKRQDGLRQALAGKYDGVILYGVDCPGNEQPLKDLIAAQIPVASISGVDCDKPLFTADVKYPLVGGESGKAVGLYEAWGRSQADYVISKTDGRAKVILFEVPSYSVLKSEAKAFKDRIEECGGCSIVEGIEVVAADMGGPSLAQKADQGLLKHPEANVVVAPYDDLLNLGVANSVRQSGRSDDLLVLGGNGLEPVVDMVRADKGVDAGFGYDFTWDHYAAVTSLMSALDGKPVPTAGQPVVFYDRDHNLPESGPWRPEVDFEAAFEAAWGVR